MIKGSKLFEGGVADDDNDAELDQAIRDVFNSKNEQLIQKNQSLLNLADDERNEKIKEFVEQNNVLIPIGPIEGGADGLHLIGTVRTFIELEEDGEPMVRVGGGKESLKDYHENNKRHFKTVIFQHMQASNSSYDQVVDGLLKGQKKFSNLASATMMAKSAKKQYMGPEQGKFEEVKEGEEGKTRHDGKTDFKKDVNVQMKELRGTLKFKVLKQKAPKSGGTGAEDDDGEIIISHLINPKLAVDYKSQNQESSCDGDMKDDNGK